VIALVIPVYRHSILLFDAIHSLAKVEDTRIIIVDDGCPNLETQFAGLGLAALYPNITYMRGRNLGLSGARNRGIDHILANLPEAEAIYFLDADNMLSDWSLPQMRAALAQHPEDDWFYPDIRMFGLEWEAEYNGAFSPLVESLLNICEAGSLVRRRVFEAGLRFSESLKLGFEDWDFWLTAIEHGFRGRHFPASGFRYRKRPESMLANAARDEDRIRGHLEQRHRWLRDVKWAVTAEHRTAPRYAIYLADLGIVRLTSSGEMITEEMSWDAYITRFWAALRAPKQNHAGAVFIISSSLNLAALLAAGLLAWALFDLELRLRDCNIAALRLQRHPAGRMMIETPKIGAEPQAVLAGLSIDLLRQIAEDTTEAWFQSAATAAPLPRISTRTTHLAGEIPFLGPMGDILRWLVRATAELRHSEFATASGMPAQDCARGTPDRAHFNRLLRAKFGGGILPPAFNRRGPEIAFAIPKFEFGGVEKVTMFVARALRRRGYTVSLILLKSQSIMRADNFADAFDRVFFLDNPEFESWSGPSYLGTTLSRWSVFGEHANELNLLSIFDAVIACHGADVMGLMGNLQRRGVITAAYNHLFDATETGRHVGHPHIALAFEHALDLFICCSRDIGARMHAHGVPGSKITIVPNATGIDISPAIAAESLSLHLARDEPRLNILFIGRIDPQKGLDRLLEIAAHLRTGLANIRIIGRPVITEPGTFPEFDGVAEDPVQGADLLDAYRWADILLLPSFFEGLPLTIIEAMQMGVVPIATQTGAIVEVIHNGANGFIVTQDGCVPETLARIAELTADRATLREMMREAASAPRNWDDAVNELDETLRHRLAGPPVRQREPLTTDN
jgi:glycosyltransferase involved in cell wall biosynthesis